MAATDPIGDLLARINNAHMALKADMSVPASKMKAAIVGILKDEGFINEYEVKDGQIVLTLKYAKGKPIIRGLKRVSKPGRRVYVGYQDIPKVLNGLGVCIVSTSRGVLAGEKARADNLGGELLCEVW